MCHPARPGNIEPWARRRRDARSNGLRNARRSVDAIELSMCRVHAMYSRHISGGTSRQRGHSLFFQVQFFAPETTPEGGERPKGRKPPAPRFSPFGKLVDPSVEGERGSTWGFPTDTTRGLRLSVCVVCPKIRRAGPAGVRGYAGADSVEVATRATHCILTLSSCPEYPTPQRRTQRGIWPSSGTLRDSSTVTCSDAGFDVPSLTRWLAPCVSAPSRRISATSARTPLCAAGNPRSAPRPLSSRPEPHTPGTSRNSRTSYQHSIRDFPFTPG